MCMVDNGILPDKEKVESNISSARPESLLQCVVPVKGNLVSLVDLASELYSIDCEFDSQVSWLLENLEIYHFSIGYGFYEMKYKTITWPSLGFL